MRLFVGVDVDNGVRAVLATDLLSAAELLDLDDRHVFEVNEVHVGSTEDSDPLSGGDQNLFDEQGNKLALCWSR